MKKDNTQAHGQKKWGHGSDYGHAAHEVINHIRLGVITINSELAVLEANASAARLMGEGNDFKSFLEHCQGEPLGVSDWGAELRGALTRGEPTLYEPVQCQCSRRKRTLQFICLPFAEGEWAGRGLVLIEDLTEKLLLEKDLALSERLAALGKLAAQVAHELNNPLDGILRYINLSIRVAQEHELESLTRYLHESRDGLQRMVQILSELLDFSRSSYIAASEADINKIVEEAVHAMDVSLIRGGIEVVREYQTPMPNVRSGNLFQVFSNLIKNGADAMAEHNNGQTKSLVIRTYCDEQGAVVEFLDDGPGLSDEVAAQMFEPFFTTKPASRGTGLGLAICQEIMERYGGTISGANRAEGGSVFRVTIPVNAQWK